MVAIIGYHMYIRVNVSVFLFYVFSVCFYSMWPPIGKIAAHSAYDMFHGIST